MQDNLSIANSALYDLNVDEIMSFDDPCKAARVIKNKFQTVMDTILGSNTWLCNRSFNYLNRDSSIDTYGWDYVYNLPKDNLYTRAIIPVDEIKEISAEVVKQFSVYGAATVHSEHYMLANNKVYTNATAIVCVYSKRITDCNYVSNYLVAAITKLLAAEIAYPLTQDRQVRADQFGFYDDALRKARAANAREENPIIPTASTLSVRN